MTFKASIASEVRKVQVRYLAIRGTAAPLTEENKELARIYDGNSKRIISYLAKTF